MACQGLPGQLAHHISARFYAASGTLQARLHNFVKYALLQQLVPPGSTVCDLYCGQGLDTGKWAQAQIGRYVGVDFSASTLEEAREQWNNHNRPYSADFCELDPSSANLETELRYMGVPADFVTCMGHLQACFYKEEMVRSLLKNVAAILRPGGYFFGITADSSTIWSKFQKAVEGAHRAGVFRSLPRVHSEHYTISFEDDRFTPFGTRYTLQFGDGVVFEGQQLIHFPSFIRLAEEVGLEYIELQNLQEFYDDYRLQFPDILRATCANLVDPKGRLPQFAHDILSLYTTFIFRKAEYLDPDYMLSPFPSPDEQLELCSEDICDGHKASFQEHMSPPKDFNNAPKMFTTTFQQIETKEAFVLRSEEEQRHQPTTVHIEENISPSPKADAPKENVNMDDTKSSCKQSEFEREEVKLESSAVVEDVLTTGRTEDIEIQTSLRSLESSDIAMMEASEVPCNGLADKENQQPMTCMEEQVLSDLPPEASSRLSKSSGSPSNVVSEQQGITDTAVALQLQADNGVEDMREALITLDVTEEMVLEKEQTLTEITAVVETVSKQSFVHAALSSEDPSNLRDRVAPLSPPPPPPPPPPLPLEDPPPVETKDMGLTDLEAKEMEVEKVNNQQSDDMKNDMFKETEVPVETAPEKTPSSGIGLGTEDSTPVSKERANPTVREESFNGFSKRLNSSGPHPYRAGRPHHYHHHLSHSEERQDHSHGLRHSSQSSHKASRDRVGDIHRSEHSSPSQRGDVRRVRARRAAHPSPAPPTPAFVPFSHFVPQTEFPIFHSPNTPGLLGPGPQPVLLIEPICPLWPIPPPLDRRVFPKTRTPRKHVSERDSSGSRSRRESPKRHWKDSPPPPGTEAS